MAPLELEGKTLGEKHRHFNKLVKEAIVTNKSSGSGDVSTSDNDIESLIQIDIASNKKDVEYILNVLKCEDMLYVSRAIKQSTWLITDRQYSHIINPNYLHKQLFPQMTSKASAKLLLHIRLNLKDEEQVADFYNFLKVKDAKTAVKWLPYCPLSVIEKEVEINAEVVDNHLLKRLCERSSTVLEKYIHKCEYYKRDKLKAVMFLINTDTDKYLDIIESLEPYQIPSFGPKNTEKLMKKCRQRIIDKFEKYCFKIDRDTFAKNLKKEEIKDFLSKQADNKEIKNWFTYDNLKHFVKYMPKEGRFEFLKKIFIEKNTKEQETEVMEDFYCAMADRCSAPVAPTSSANIYRWYRFAPFETAFLDLTKLIRAESLPTERIAMFGVLIFCASRNPKHVETLLQYYHDKHINEPFKFKIQFVNMVLSNTKTHRFDENTWSILNKIFYSMEVYRESDNNVQCCVEAIVVYKILHNETIPEIIEKKFSLKSIDSVQKKLNKEENEKIFDYLYKSYVTKISNKQINSENDFVEALDLLEKMESLLINWKRELIDYPWIHEKIKEYIKLKNNNSWKSSLSSLYEKKKSWRKIMFQESIAMSPCGKTCYNALKHDPELLIHYKSVLDTLRSDDNISLKRFLKTLRQFWPQSLAKEWATIYLERLDQPEGHKALVRGICALLPQKQVVDIIKKYAPTEPKINWSEDNERVLSLRKQLAKNMHLTRPHPPPEVVMLYAQGDYLQFVLPSLNAVLHNMSSVRIREHVKMLLDAPVSLQKHGIRYTFTKLETKELKEVFSNIWKRTKNASIRAVLFKQTYNLLCREKKPAMIEEVWELLSMFIENLSTEENKMIYEILGKVDKVPLLVRGKFFMKSYNCLKALPAKANCESIVNDLMYKMSDLMEHLESDFVSGVLLESLENKFTKERYQHSQIMAAFLLCSKDEESQSDKFKKTLLPALEYAFPMWNVKSECCFYASRNTIEVLEQIAKYFQIFVCDKKMFFPTKLFIEILNVLERGLPIEDNYLTLRTWKLIVAYIKSLEEHKDYLAKICRNADEESKPESDYYNPKLDDKWNEFYLKAIPKFTGICLQYLKEDIEKYFPSIYLIFAEALEHAFDNIHQLVYLECLKCMLVDEKFVESYLVALKNVGDYCYEGDETKSKVKEIREKIFSHHSAEIKIHYLRKYRRHDVEDTCAAS